MSRLTPALLLLALSLALRLHFFSGFILGDDWQEHMQIERIVRGGPSFTDQYEYRFSVWAFNAFVLKLLGSSEATFFLPTLIMSASFAPIGYLVLMRCGYARPEAALAGLLIATAPFEILIGTVRANDLILSWFLALAILALVALEERPAWQGSCLAVLLWLGFYTKLWALYALPALGAYYAIRLLRAREWRSPLAFALTSGVLHLAAAVVWKATFGMFVPFLTLYAATYPVPPERLASVLLEYPRMIFRGSEFHTTLFGVIPHLLIGLLAAKALLAVVPRLRGRGLAFDRLDAILAVHYLSFFILLNFFPATFKFDQYYSVPRIFRYLAPLSFPMTLHAAKLLIDLTRALAPAPRAVAGAAVGLLVVVNVAQAAEAVRPGSTYRRVLLAVVDDVRRVCPPRLLMELWTGYFVKEVYLRGTCASSSVITPWIHPAREYEAWLEERQEEMPPGTLLVTGLGSYVHYGCHGCGFRLNQFRHPLDARWTLVAEYGMLDYLPVPEPARLWRLTRSAAAERAAARVRLALGDARDPEGLFRQGMKLFDASRFTEARAYFAAILDHHADSRWAEDAHYFRAVTYWREGDLQATMHEFAELVRHYPQGRWVGAAHFHMGLARKQMGNTERARRHFSHVVRRFSSDAYNARLAAKELRHLPKPTIWQRVWR